MTKRVILAIPEGLTFDQLSGTQKNAISIVFRQYVNPMPGTVSYDGKQIVDALTIDGFNPLLMAEYDLADWEILGLYVYQRGVATYTNEEGVEEQTIINGVATIQVLDETEFLNFLPDIVEYDEAGNVVSTIAPTFHMPHKWAGLPEEKVEYVEPVVSEEEGEGVGEDI